MEQYWKVSRLVDIFKVYNRIKYNNYVNFLVSSEMSYYFIFSYWVIHLCRTFALLQNSGCHTLCALLFFLAKPFHSVAMPTTTQRDPKDSPRLFNGCSTTVQRAQKMDQGCPRHPKGSHREPEGTSAGAKGFQRTLPIYIHVYIYNVIYIYTYIYICIYKRPINRPSGRYVKK